MCFDHFCIFVAYISAVYFKSIAPIGLRWVAKYDMVAVAEISDVNVSFIVFLCFFLSFFECQGNFFDEVINIIFVL